MLDVGLKLSLYHPHAPHPLKVTDIDFFCLMKCLYHISQSSESIHISNRVCFHSITLDPRVHADGDGAEKCILLSLAMHDSGELRCPETALIMSPQPKGRGDILLLGGWFGREMVLGNFQCRRVLLLWHMVGRGLLCLQQVRYGWAIFLFSHLIYPIFLF